MAGLTLLLIGYLFAACLAAVLWAVVSQVRGQATADDQRAWMTAALLGCTLGVGVAGVVLVGAEPSYPLFVLTLWVMATLVGAGGMLSMSASPARKLIGRRLFQSMGLGLLSCVLWASALLAAVERLRQA